MVIDTITVERNSNNPFNAQVRGGAFNNYIIIILLTLICECNTYSHCLSEKVHRKKQRLMSGGGGEKKSRIKPFFSFCSTMAPNREYDIRKPLPKQQRGNCTEKTRTQVFCRQRVPEHLAAAVVVGQA